MKHLSHLNQPRSKRGRFKSISRVCEEGGRRRDSGYSGSEEAHQPDKLEARVFYQISFIYIYHCCLVDLLRFRRGSRVRLLHDRKWLISDWGRNMFLSNCFISLVEPHERLLCSSICKP